MWLERLGVAEEADSKVDALSHGNQQRVQLAAALVHGPELLILDEPLAGLDPTGIDAIAEVLAEQARSGCCVLFSSHQLDQVEDLCESVTIIDHGRLVVTGKVDDLATSGPRRLVVRVEGDREASWAHAIAGVTVSEVDGGAARLVLEPSVDSDSVLKSAMGAGRVDGIRLRTPQAFRGLPGGTGVKVALIAVVAVMVASVRLWLRRRARGPRRACPGVARGSVLFSGDVALVAAREIRERLRGRIFRVGTVVILAAVAAAIVIPVLTRTKAQPQQVGVVGSLPAPFRTAVLASAASVGTKVNLVHEPSLSAARRALGSGSIDLAIVQSRELLVNKAIGANDTSTTAQLVLTLAQNLGVVEAMVAAKLSAAQASLLTNVKPLHVAEHPTRKAEGGHLDDIGGGCDSRVHNALAVQHLDPDRRDGGEVEPSGGGPPRRCSPVKLLAGKVLGIGLVAFSQAALIVAFALWSRRRWVRTC